MERERIARLLWNASEDFSSDNVKCAWEPMAPTEEGQRFLAMADAVLSFMKNIPPTREESNG